MIGEWRRRGVLHPYCCGSSCKEKAGSQGSNTTQREQERGWADGECHQTATEKEGGWAPRERDGGGVRKERSESYLLNSP